MKTYLARRAYFSCGRQLRVLDLSPEQNRAAFGRDVLPHGIDCTLDIYYSGEIEKHDGMIVNLSDLKPILSNTLAPLDDSFLDRDLPYFQRHPPTAENLAQYLWDALPPRVGQGTLSRLRLQETARTFVEIHLIENSGTAMKLTRCYEFAAAHRLHVPQMSDAENTELYGKCNNPSGHGHNYGLEVTLEGIPNAKTGSIISLPDLDKIVDEEIFERFDHKHLNVDCPEFENLVPTSENLARVIFEILEKSLKERGYKLAKIGLHETTKNYFEVEA